MREQVRARRSVVAGVSVLVAGALGAASSSVYPVDTFVEVAVGGTVVALLIVATVRLVLRTLRGRRDARP